MNRRVLKRIRNEAGQALLLVIALLGVGGIMLAPLLSFMGDGLKGSQLYEIKSEELYAADAGVEDAIWQINNLGEPGAIPYEYLDELNEIYYYTEDEEPVVNGMTVEVSIQYLEPWNGGVYRVLSDAGETRVDAIIASVWLDFKDITNYVVTTPGYFEENGPCSIFPAEGEEHGPQEGYGGPWPSPEDLITWYSRDVDKEDPYPDYEIDLDGGDLILGPTYVDGDFSIINSTHTDPDPTLYLTGTLYITGDAVFGSTKQNFTIDLDGPDPDNPVPQTIFVESSTMGSQDALTAGNKCTFVGSGCVIAVGDIWFEPNIETDSSDYMLVLTVIGETWMHPNGDFYGTLAGLTDVYLQNGDILWSEPPLDLNFPLGGGAQTVWGIHTWEIS